MLKMWQKSLAAFGLPFYNIFVPQKVAFRKFLMTTLHVIGGLPPPPIKNLGYAYARRYNKTTLNRPSLLEGGSCRMRFQPDK